MTAAVSPTGPTTRLAFTGRLDLAFAGRFLHGWPPATHPGMSADGGLRLGFVTDDLSSTAGVTLRQRSPDHLDAHFSAAATDSVIAQVRRIFSLDADALGFEAAGHSDERLATLQTRSPGARPVLFANPYEAAVWAILSARVPAARAAALRRDLMAAHGDVLDFSGVATAVLPTPLQLLTVDELAGTPAEKVRRLHSVAQAAIDGVLDPQELGALSTWNAIERLKSVRGIGDFYAQLIYVRALAGDLVPSGESRLLAAAGALVGTAEPLSPAEFDALLSRWAPFRAWAAFLLRTT